MTMPKSYTPVLEGEDFCQGDVVSVRWDSSAPLSDLRELAIVLTADCDIAQKKMGSHYTLLTLVDARDYIKKIWMRSEIEKKSLRLTKELLESLQKFSSDAQAEEQIKSFYEWLENSEPESVATRLALNPVSDAVNKVGWIKSARLHCRNPDSIPAFFVTLLQWCQSGTREVDYIFLRVQRWNLRDSESISIFRQLDS
jgi:hypothetical protein